MKLLRMIKTKKKAKKKAKRLHRLLAVCAVFCAGAACMGWFVYKHRRVIAAAVNGTRILKSPHKHCRGK